jgi:hypothetical protein
MFGTITLMPKAIMLIVEVVTLVFGVARNFKEDLKI